MTPAAKADLAVLSGYAHNDAYLRGWSPNGRPVFSFIIPCIGRESEIPRNRPPSLAKS